MPLWAWCGFVLMIAYNSFVLWRAAASKFFRYGPIIYSLNDEPVYFWFFLVLFSICEIFLVGFFSLCIISTIWGPIANQ